MKALKTSISMLVGSFHYAPAANKRNLCLFVIFFYSASFASGADFVILETPRSFALYNQFEQPLATSEAAELLPYSPFQIINVDARLGDGITRAMQCSFMQKTYYFLKDDQGAVIGDKERLQIVKGCTIMSDTVEIAQGGAVAFSRRAMTPGPSSLLQKGAVLVVQFRFKNSYYALLTGPRPQFGWVSVTALDAWKRVAEALASTADTAMTPQTLGRIIERIESANAQYKVFFDRFNRGAGLRKSPPHWQRVGLSGRLAWDLSGPYNHTGELDESANYLVEDLRDILIGKQFSVRYEKGEITITPKALP